ncbi:translation initiation factor IF-2 [Polycladomyces abyssicola]|uniref:Translation initiation factor IF-2 n=1 Tax=Polycladomyces abyssicola TaxID=1125966 RepID=A0A8D5UGJ4_9BACL|nr:translation initiation factor IF-2 [Polycladomyces abyssicola]BCU82056.1 translation initiation factor IF-2 [Polycladomyces abyssicola]
MTKLRVYEYAKQMNMSSKEVLTILQRMNINVNNHMSVMDDQMVQKVEQFIKKVKEQNTPGKAKPAGTSGNKRPNGSSKSQGEIKGQAKVTEQKNMGGKNKEVNMKKQRNKAANDNGETVGVKGKPSRKGTFDNRENGGKKGRGKKQKDRNRRPQQWEKPAPKLPSEIEISGPMTVGEAAKLMRREAADVIRKLMGLGVMATINQEIDTDTITLVAEEYGIKVKVKEEIDESAFEEIEEIDAPEDLQERPPVVTIMGHVDHGKTTLLDTIRHSNITAGEAGGITQHIGAYQVEANGKKITFLDTPGHAAFTTMRARGAKVTDITVLVVAADDGVMPQTVEAINHAKAADVPIIVAVNKMDKPDANPDRVKQQLMEHGLVPEEWGGDTIFVPVSALKGEGIDELLEMILLVAEVQELKANSNKRARGVVIEAELDKGRGPVATVLVQNGTLRVGDSIVAGNYFGKVRAMVNDRGRRVKAAPPSTPVEILGLQDVPNAGDAFMVFEDEKKARAIAEKRAEKQRQQELRAQSRVTLDDLYKQIQEGEVKELNIIIKADVQGSVEALRGALEKIDVEGVRVKIIHSAVGAITESDIILASASNAIIIGFNVRPETNARAAAEQEKVDIRLHRVIYDVIEEIEAAMKGMLDPEYEEKVVGSAEVRQIFKVSRIGTIAGCYVTEGKIVRDGKVRLIRDGIVVHEGEIDTLKRFKDDVREVAQGYECGLTLKNFNDIKEGDVVEVYVIQEVER